MDPSPPLQFTKSNDRHALVSRTSALRRPEGQVARYGIMKDWAAAFGARNHLGRPDESAVCCLNNTPSRIRVVMWIDWIRLQHIAILQHAPSEHVQCQPAALLSPSSRKTELELCCWVSGIGFGRSHAEPIEGELPTFVFLRTLPKLCEFTA